MTEKQFCQSNILQPDTDCLEREAKCVVNEQPCCKPFECIEDLDSQDSGVMAITICYGAGLK